MVLDVIKKHIKCGKFNEARKLIEKVDSIESLEKNGGVNNGGMENSVSSFDDQFSPPLDVYTSNLPLLVMLSLIKDEDSALSLSRLLLEKGYNLSACDQNGLCALNYAIALKRFKLLTLFLSSFNFELDTYRDCYKNTFLHYVFATNNKQIIDKFHETYAKYYEWNVEKFRFVKNCDGLSLKDLNDYFEYLTHRQAYLKRMRDREMGRVQFDTDDGFDFNSYQIPECFKLHSNPILICNYISKVFHKTNSTLKSELVFLTNNTRSVDSSFMSPGTNSSRDQHEFKLNLLYQIKGLNKTPRPKTSATILPNKVSTTTVEHRVLKIGGPGGSKTNSNLSIVDLRRNNNGRRASQILSPISTSEHVPRTLNHFNHNKLSTDEVEIITPLNIRSASTDKNPPAVAGVNGAVTAVAAGSQNWRNMTKRIFGDYSVITSPSYRLPTAVIQKLHNGAAANFSSTTPTPSSNTLDLNNKNHSGSNGNYTNGQENQKRLNTSYVIKPVSGRDSVNGLNSDSKSKGGSGQAKYDFYMVPSSLVSKTNGGTNANGKIK